MAKRIDVLGLGADTLFFVYLWWKNFEEVLSLELAGIILIRH